MLQQSMDFLSQYDPEVGASIREEFTRECRNIELIASENLVSEAVMLAMGTCLTNKYAEGYPGSAIMAAVMLWMSRKKSPASGPASSLAAGMPMSSLTPVPMPIWPLL